MNDLELAAGREVTVASSLLSLGSTSVTAVLDDRLETTCVVLHSLLQARHAHLPACGIEEHVPQITAAVAGMSYSPTLMCVCVCVRITYICMYFQINLDLGDLGSGKKKTDKYIK